VGLPIAHTHKGNQSTKGVYKRGCAKPETKQTHPSPWTFLKEHAKRLVNIGKANLVVDEIVEDIMATIISREANLGVISIVDNEGLEVNKD